MLEMVLRPGLEIASGKRVFVLGFLEVTQVPKQSPENIWKPYTRMSDMTREPWKTPTLLEQQLTTRQDEGNDPKWAVFRHACITALLPSWEDDLNEWCQWYSLVVFFSSFRSVPNVLSPLNSEEQTKIRTEDTKQCLVLSTYWNQVPGILNMWNVWKIFILNAIYKRSH